MEGLFILAKKKGALEEIEEGICLYIVMLYCSSYISIRGTSF